MKSLGAGLMGVGGTLLFLDLVVGAELAGPSHGLLAIATAVLLLVWCSKTQAPAAPRTRDLARFEFEQTVAHAAWDARAVGPHDDDAVSAPAPCAGETASWRPPILQRLRRKGGSLFVPDQTTAVQGCDIRRVFAVDGRAVAAVLVDARLVGWNGDDYALYPNLETYRVLTGDWRVHHELTSEDEKDAFAAMITQARRRR